MKNVDKQLKGFMEANPDHQFRIRRCEHTNKHVVQVKSRTEVDEWTCLHDFFHDNKHYKLGEGF